MLKIQKFIKLIISVLIVNCIYKASAFPQQNARKCNCILLKHCDSFMSVIDNSDDMTLLTTTIAEATCKFDGSNIYVCCPERSQRKRHVKVKTKLDYLDELTGKNCPPSFGHEHSYDDYLKEHNSDSSETSEEDFTYEKDSGEDDHHGHTKTKEDHRIMCDYFGNCGRLKFPIDESATPAYNYNYHHHHHHSSDNDNRDQKFEAPLYPLNPNPDRNYDNYRPQHNNQHQHRKKHPHHRHHNRNPSKNEPASTASTSQFIPTYYYFEYDETPTTCGYIPEDTSEALSSEVYPWITRLAYLNTTSRSIRYRCLGTIVTEQHVLTAAHCVDNLVKDLRLIFVRVGDDINFDDFKIIETLIHPKYNEPLFNNDVALIRLTRTRNSRVPFINICLPQTDSKVLIGHNGIVAGWSEKALSNSDSATIRYINLPVMNNTECAIRYAKYSENFENSIVITPSEFCAQAEKPMNDVCEGDSGGPFMERTPSGTYTLLGIVAFGPKTNCGQSNLPGVYMRVSSYVEWIKSNIN